MEVEHKIPGSFSGQNTKEVIRLYNISILFKLVLEVISMSTKLY
jgi:hypothetical protein